jgi:hypothetical protein
MKRKAREIPDFYAIYDSFPNKNTVIMPTLEDFEPERTVGRQGAVLNRSFGAFPSLGASSDMLSISEADNGISYPLIFLYLLCALCLNWCIYELFPASSKIRRRFFVSFFCISL